MPFLFVGASGRGDGGRGLVRRALSGGECIESPASCKKPFSEIPLGVKKPVVLLPWLCYTLSTEQPCYRVADLYSYIEWGWC